LLVHPVGMFPHSLLGCFWCLFLWSFFGGARALPFSCPNLLGFRFPPRKLAQHNPSPVPPGFLIGRLLSTFSTSPPKVRSPSLSISPPTLLFYFTPAPPRPVPPSFWFFFELTVGCLHPAAFLSFPPSFHPKAPHVFGDRNLFLSLCLDAGFGGNVCSVGPFFPRGPPVVPGFSLNLSRRLETAVSPIRGAA